MTTPAAVACRGVWKVFGPRPEHAWRTQQFDGHVVAVRDVSFEVRPGETFVIMGLSGSGKSTLVRCLSRLTEPTAGEIVLAGQDVLKLREIELRELRRRSVSMVFQNFGLLPHRRVLDNVAYGLEVRGTPLAERKARALAMIEKVGLAGWETRFPRELSGGMQQRVGLARALAGDPAIVLYDEPFSALDPLIRREMQDELLRLQGELHKTSVFITHDFAEALRLGDHIAIMRNGAIVQIGTPEALVLAPANDYVRAFVQDAPRARVLRLRSIMQPLDASLAASDAPRLRAEQVVETALPVVAAYDGQVLILDEREQPCGCIDRGCVMQALTGAES